MFSAFSRTLVEAKAADVLRNCSDLSKPATFGDDLIVTTALVRQSAARIVLKQRVIRGEEVLFSSIVTLVCLKIDGSPTRVPQAFRDAAGEMAK